MWDTCFCETRAFFCSAVYVFRDFVFTELQRPKRLPLYQFLQYTVHRFTELYRSKPIFFR